MIVINVRIIRMSLKNIFFIDASKTSNKTNSKASTDAARKALAKKYKSDDPFWNAFNLMHGNPYIETRNDVKVVRVFTSSTFTGL